MTLVAARKGFERGYTSTCIMGQGLPMAKFPDEPPLGHGAALADLIQKISKVEKR